MTKCKKRPDLRKTVAMCSNYTKRTMQIKCLQKGIYLPQAEEYTACSTLFVANNDKSGEGFLYKKEFL